MKKHTFFIALALAFPFIFMWEMYWRDQGFRPYHDPNDDLWSLWRREVANMEDDDVLLIGSSRTHFDLDIYVWEELTGNRPITLASGGMSPGPVLKDLAENTDFKSTLIIGIAPDLFFDLPGQGGWNRPQDRLDYFKKQTYAQRLNQAVFMQIDPHFAYINKGLLLKGLIDYVPFPPRDSVRPPMIWPDMTVSDENWDLKMIPEMATDTVMQNAYKHIWASFGWNKPDSTKTDTAIAMYVGWVQKIKARGGKVIFMRAPSTGTYRSYEAEAYPRAKFWDRLLLETNCPGIHFEDYPALQGFDCPEWSHLLPDDAKVYTKEFVTILQREGHLIPKN